MEEKRITILHLLRDLIVMQQEGIDVEPAIRATVAELNEIESALGIDSKPPEYYLSV